MNNTNLFPIMRIQSRVATPAPAILIPPPRSAGAATQGMAARRTRQGLRSIPARRARGRGSSLSGCAGPRRDGLAPVSGAGRI